MRNPVVYLFAIFIFLQSQILLCQTGTEFWFAAPDVSQQHYNNSRPLNIHITALYNTHVVISRPADPGFIPLEFDLAARQSKLTILDSLMSIDEIEVYATDISNPSFVQNKGFVIESYPGEINACYELGGLNNTDIAALKSKNGLGKDFWVSTQRKYINHGYADDFSGFVVVATEDGTIVEVNPNGNNLQFHGSAPFLVSLNKGEAFAVRASGQAASEHIFGIHVTSNRDIAITIFDDSMQIDDGGGNWDIFIDQIVPTSLVGLEYVVVKGEVQDVLANTDDAEAVFITSTEDNTDIIIDGMFVANMPLAGGYLSYDIKNLATHIYATKPVYVNHITGYSTIPDGSRELGGAILPTVDKCTGSHNVTVKRTLAPELIFLNNLYVRNDTAVASPTRNLAIHNFTYSINGGPPQPINPDQFTYIMDSAFAVYDRGKAGTEAFYNSVNHNEILRVENTISRFHLGVLQARQSPGCRYAYFSDFGEARPSAGIGGAYSYNQDIVCGFDSVQLIATGGFEYEWTATYTPDIIDHLSGTDLADPWFYPPEEGNFFFQVKISSDCFSDTTISLNLIVYEPAQANFLIEDTLACGSLTTTLTNTTDFAKAEKMIWEFENPYQEVNQDTVPSIQPLNFPLNNTDTIQTYPIALKAFGPFNTCPSVKRDTVRIYPDILASFSIDNSAGCSPLVVQTTNTSSGDTSTYYWNSGFGEENDLVDPQFTYTFIEDWDTAVTLSLVAISPFGCSDTATGNIYINPNSSIQLSADNWEACSPLQSILTVTGFETSDSLHWQFNYGSGIDELIVDSISLYKEFINETALSDTIGIELRVIHDNGCTSLQKNRFIVYPNTVAEFVQHTSGICSPVNVDYENLSVGASSFLWDFGNGNISSDFSPSASFELVNAMDTSFITSLIAISEYGCSDTSSSVINVYSSNAPKLSMTASAGCSPFESIVSGSENLASDSLLWFAYFPGFIDSVWTKPGEPYMFEYQNSSESNDTIPFRLLSFTEPGCDAPLDTFLIVYPEPVADFEISFADMEYPLTISTMNLSRNSTAYEWDLGDGTIAYSENVNHSYTSNTDTVFTIQLNAISVNCADTAFGEVPVVGHPLAHTGIPIHPDQIKIFIEANSSQLIVDYTGETCELFQIVVYTISGQLAERKVLNESMANGQRTSIQLDALLPGSFYIVILETGSGNFSQNLYYP